MKAPKSEPVSTGLDPSHPNYDAILLKKARLEAHRRRRMENRGEGYLGATPAKTEAAKSRKTAPKSKR